MRMQRPRRRPGPEATVPLINVVFLLLIFFMLAGEITRTAPFEITPPDGAASEMDERDGHTVYVAADGRLAVGDRTGLDVSAVARAVTGRDTVLVAADADAPAARLVALMDRLRAAGIEAVRLRTRGDA